VRTAICLEEHCEILINVREGQTREHHSSKSPRPQRGGDSTAVRRKVLLCNGAGSCAGRKLAQRNETTEVGILKMCKKIQHLMLGIKGQIVGKISYYGGLHGQQAILLGVNLSRLNIDQSQNSVIC